MTKNQYIISENNQTAHTSTPVIVFISTYLKQAIILTIHYQWTEYRTYTTTDQIVNK